MPVHASGQDREEVEDFSVRSGQHGGEGAGRR
jgi:hypothetical protein